MMYNVPAEFADSLDRRPLSDRARLAVFSSIPDAVRVSGQITGEAAALSDLEAVKAVLPDIPVLANTGVKHDTVADVFRLPDGVAARSNRLGNLIVSFPGDADAPSVMLFTHMD